MALPRGTPSIAPGAVETIRVEGEFGRSEPMAVEGPGFAQAVRVRTGKRPAESYRLQLRVTTTMPVNKGPKLLAVFHARAVEPQAHDKTGEAEFVFEAGKEVATKITLP